MHSLNTISAIKASFETVFNLGYNGAMKMVNNWVVCLFVCLFVSDHSDLLPCRLKNIIRKKVENYLCTS